VTFDSAPAAIPTRNIVIHAKKLPLLLTPWTPPSVLLDGNRFPMQWGANVFTIPTDRPVHVQCQMPSIITYGVAAVVVEPFHTPELEYSPPGNQWFPGELGAPGTTNHRGSALTYSVLGVLGLVVVGAIFAFIAAIAFS
jgi:hypothetical protein